MIDLSTIPLVSAEPQVQDFGGVLTPPLGGPVQRINRVGTRWAMGFETPLLAAEPDLRIWSARLARAKVEGALIWVPEPGFAHTGVAGAIVSTTVPSTGSTLSIDQAPGTTLPEGKWLSIVHDGRRYLHRVAVGGTANGSGYLQVAVFPAFRTILFSGDVVELAAPKMQGTLTGSFGWSIPLDVAALSFTISEDE